MLKFNEEEINEFMDNESKEFIKRIKGQNMELKKNKLTEKLELKYPKKIFENTENRTLKINIQNLTWKIEYDKRINFLFKILRTKSLKSNNIDKLFETLNKINFELDDGLHRYITFEEFEEYVLNEFEKEEM